MISGPTSDKSSHVHRTAPRRVQNPSTKGIVFRHHRFSGKSHLHSPVEANCRASRVKGAPVEIFKKNSNPVVVYQKVATKERSNFRSSVPENVAPFPGQPHALPGVVATPVEKVKSACCLLLTGTQNVALEACAGDHIANESADLIALA